MYITSNINRDEINKIFSSCHVLWTSDNLKMEVDNTYSYIPNISYLLLFSDGSFTKILDSINNEMTKVKLIHYRENTENCNNFGQFKMYRQGWLINDLGYKILFASSWHISQNLAHSYSILPLGKVFTNSELILYRRLYRISCLCSKWFESQFNSEGYIWSREYTLFHNKHPYIFIQEFFSPQLTNKWKKIEIKYP